MQFQKLEKVEVGGNKGRTLSASVYQIYADFTSVLDAFKKLPYDALDVETKQFDDDFYDFRCQIKELERRLGAQPGLRRLRDGLRGLQAHRGVRGSCSSTSSSRPTSSGSTST